MKWDYASFSIGDREYDLMDTRAGIQAIGDDGWELISIVAITTREQLAFYFKRARES